MKAFMMMLVICAIGAILFSLSRDLAPKPESAAVTAVATPPPYSPPLSDQPVLMFGGQISQHTADGLLVHCEEFIRGLPPGYTLDDIRGDFLLVGHPREHDLADGYHLRFEARHAGLVQYQTIFGATKTVMKIVYVASEARQPVPPRAINPLNLPHR